MNLNPMLLCDFYKLSHRTQYPTNTTEVYSTWTPRTSRVPDLKEVIVFGTQYFIKKYLIELFDKEFFTRPENEIINDYIRTIHFTLGIRKEEIETAHISYLHGLGYLPLKIRAIEEGSRVPIKVPILSVENTDPNCFWLTNFIETLMSCELWQATTSASLASVYKDILNKYSQETTDDLEFVPFQGHDFSMRGMSSLDSAMISGAAHLTSFVGTDTIPAIGWLEHYYNADVEKELVGTSVPATEHSVQCSYGDDHNYIKRMITEVHPDGIISVVSDGYDFWKVMKETLPSLKSQIMARDGKVVIRPDSGDPVDIICGTDSGATEEEKKGAVEILWDMFGGTINSKGFKVLDSHIGLIYGDAITPQRCTQICEKLKAKGFSSVNVVYGIGSFTYQYNTRDTFGFALKASSCTIDGEQKDIFKDPKTDDGTKKSAKGKVKVVNRAGSLICKDQQTEAEIEQEDNELQVIFLNGKLVKETSLTEIRQKINR